MIETERLLLRPPEKADWAFRELQPSHLISLINPDYARSLRVAQKLGERYQRDVSVNGAVTQLWALASPA